MNYEDCHKVPIEQLIVYLQSLRIRGHSYVGIMSHEWDMSLTIEPSWKEDEDENVTNEE
jgi:hypothetical protein